ncbi:MAG: Fic family protein [Candidatus Shapirobacteria bacterium]|jgi:Fic family protein
MISYYFNELDCIKRYLIEIEAIKIVTDKLKIKVKREELIQRKSILKSSIFSARIEGNPLGLKNYQAEDNEKIHRQEIENLLKAYTTVYFRPVPLELSVEWIKRLHGMVMSEIDQTRAGKYRQEAWGIFNEWGFPIYKASAYFEVPKLMEEYVNYINNLGHHPAIISAIGQFIFEKIHPFADGNGRVGRLISAWILRRGGYHFRGILPFEEYLDKHRSNYYRSLEPSKDMTAFVEYFVKSIAETGRRALDGLTKKGNNGLTKEIMLPRREEIFGVINDHPGCSFDFIRRRFLAVNPKTLHYDLGQLQKKKLIVKMGSTRGAVYKINQKSKS